MPDSIRASTKQTLIDQAIAALAKNSGASLSEIAQAAGVGRATLHRYFPKREVLIRELALDAIRQTNAAIAPLYVQYEAGELRAQSLLYAMLEVMIPLGDRYQFLVTEPVAYSDPDVTAAYEAQLQATSSLVEVLKAEGSVAPEVPTAWVVTAIDSLIWGAWSAVQEGAIARNDAAALAYRTLMNGLGQ